MYIKIYLIILKLLYFVKYRHPLEIFKINPYNNYRSNIFIDLKDKNITDILTIAFTFKITSNNNKDLGWFDFAYNNINGYIVIIKNINSKYYINSETFEFIVNKCYYFIVEIKKTDINSVSYKISYNIKYGDYTNNYSFGDKKNDLYNLEFDRFYILLGSWYRNKTISENIKYENILIYNRSITIEEFQGYKLGDSKAIIFLNFSDSLTYSQYFYNKLNNNFLGGINGSSIYNDNNDIFSEFYKTTTLIQKKFYIFDKKQFIKLSQEAIKYIHNFNIQNYLVYLKISLHLNYSSISSLILNLDYNLYYRDNNTGMKINLIKLKENSTNVFEIKLALINSTSENNIISTSEILNFDYLILTYNTYTGNDNLNIKLNCKLGETEYILTDTSLKSNFLSTDNHFIGNSPSSVTDNNINYLLIELEEFLFGRGTFLEKKDNKIYYDDIVLYCNNISNNKIKRNNLNSCNNLRIDTIPLNSSNCELEDSDGNCIFKYPDVNETVNSNILNIERPYKQVFKSSSVMNSNFDSNNNFTKTDITLNFININYGTPFNINNNFVIEIILIITNSLHGNIFEIEFNSNKYSKFVVNKNLSEQKFCWEINNSSNFNNPLVKVTNLSNTNSFTIKSIKLIEIDNSKLVARDKKFIGEKVNNYNKILNDEEYSKEFFYDIDDSNNNEIEDNFKITGNFLNKCYEGCKTCTGPSLLDCQSCMDGYLKFTDNICLKIQVKNCKTYYNPFLCKRCVDSTNKKYIESILNFNSTNLCFECHSDCLIDTFCESCSISCRSCSFRYNIYNNNCYSCPYKCLLCNHKQIVCNGDLKKDCIKCKNQGINKYKNDINFPYECIQCNKVGYIDNNNKIEKCDNCDPTCKTCIGKNKYDCIECNDNFILNSNLECIAKRTNNNNICPIGYVHILKNNSNPYLKFDKCWECNSSCYECKSTNIDNCTACNTGKYLLNDQCVSSCNGNGQFLSKELDNNQRICKLCHSSCKICISIENFGCIECVVGKYLKSKNEGGYFCTDCNVQGYYIKGLNCLKCSYKCLTCVKTSYNCTSCKNNYILDSNNNICISKCKNGFYNNGNNICLPCNKSCETCTNFGDNNCIECKSSLYKDHLKNTCIPCDQLNNLIIKNKCYSCNPICQTCFGLNNNNCLSCNNNNKYLLENNNTCLDSCPINTYNLKVNNLKFCKNCYYGCLKCINSLKNSCIECNENFLFNKYTKTCFKECEEGYYKLNIKECDKCDNNCSICKSKNDCLKCNKGFYLDNENNCTICLDGYYIKDKYCYKCHKNCKTCTNYDNCISCEENKMLSYNKINKLNICKIDCKNNQYFDTINNKCNYCEDCAYCQIGNHFYCNECQKCQKICILDFKFNETGLYLFQNNNTTFNKTILNTNNKYIINSYKLKNNLIFFKIKNNIDKLKMLNFNFIKSSVLKNKNCINKKDKWIVIKKKYEKICSIWKLDYDNNTNILYIKFNFIINKVIILDRFYYYFKYSNSKIKYIIKEKNFENDYSISFKFKPNYFKNKFSINILFNDTIVSNTSCIKSKNIIKSFWINSKNIEYKNSEIKIDLEELNSQVTPDSLFSKTVNNIKPIVNNLENFTISTIIFSSFFSGIQSLLVRFSQIVYILIYILILNINLGKYTNNFLINITFNYRLNLNLDKILNISKKNQYEKILKLVTKIPKLLDYDFIYWTNWSFDYIIIIIFIIIKLILLFMIKIFKYIITHYDKKINFNRNKYNKLKKNNNTLISYQRMEDLVVKNIWNYKRKNIKFNNINNNLKYIIYKINEFKYIYIGLNIVNLLSTLFIYSQTLYLFSNTHEDIKLLLIFIFLAYLVIIYFKEKWKIITDHYHYRKQKKEYRNEFFLFDNKNYGIHNYIIIISLIRDLFIIIFGLTFLFPILYQILIFIIIQGLYLILVLTMNADFDYKNIQLFKLQESLNFILILLSLLLSIYKHEFFQFLFIILYCFLIFISLINFFYENFLNIFLLIKPLYNNLKIKFNKKNKSQVIYKIENKPDHKESKIINNNNNQIKIKKNNNRKFKKIK